MQSTAKYLNFEGAVRSGKTTVVLYKLLRYAQEYPGIQMFAGRWKEDDAMSQIKARIKELWPPDYLGRWNADEHKFECANGSSLMVRGLKPSEDAARYSKFTGKTLAVIYIDQPEEMPEDFFTALKARLSQDGVPHQLILTPNPPDEDHWLAHFFPDDNEDEHNGHQYIRTTVYDNRENLPPEYIPDLEAQYPEGHVLRLRWIEGRRGLSMVGQPVYAGCFSRRTHVTENATFNPELPLVEAWDFGHHHPAVLWSQFGLGQWNVIGELMGKDEFLEEFAPKALQLRRNLCPDVREVLSCCDPAGSHKSSHGVTSNAVDVLREHGIYPIWKEGANHPINRDGAIQKISQGFMRQVRGIPQIMIHPRCKEYIRGCEAGYVWDDSKALGHSLFPNTRRPKKDGRYDHLQNCAEYSWISYGTMQITARDLSAQKERDYWRELRQSQRDTQDFSPRTYRTSRRGIL